MHTLESDVWTADDDRISITSVFSDESDFQGGNVIREQYETRLTKYDPAEFWRIQKWNVQRDAIQSTPAQHADHGMKRKRGDMTTSEEQTDEYRQARTSPDMHNLNSVTITASKPFNPYEGVISAKQLEESLEDFLNRLPPSATTITTGPWIWVANPSARHRPLNEDIAGFRRQGVDLLEGYLTRKSELERQNPSKPAASITKMLLKKRIELEHDIDVLAKHHRVMCGKWMLFPSSTDVDQIWAIVAKRTVTGDLGCAAKVSTVDPDNKTTTTPHHLICIYTEDYSDLDNVKQVLRAMRKFNLVDDSTGNMQHNRPIYYKCDAYTYLDINNGNEFKLKASMYNSKDLFIEMKKEGSFLS